MIVGCKTSHPCVSELSTMYPIYPASCSQSLVGSLPAPRTAHQQRAQPTCRATDRVCSAHRRVARGARRILQPPHRHRRCRSPLRKRAPTTLYVPAPRQDHTVLLRPRQSIAVPAHTPISAASAIDILRRHSACSNEMKCLAACPPVVGSTCQTHGACDANRSPVPRQRRPILAACGATRGRVRATNNLHPA